MTIKRQDSVFRNPEVAAFLQGSTDEQAAELRGDGVLELDAIETLVSDGLLRCGTKGYVALLEALDAPLVNRSPPFCLSCGRRMERTAGSGRRSRRASVRFGIQLLGAVHTSYRLI